MSDTAKFVFDEGHARKLFAELARRLEAFDSFESIPEHVRAMLKECLAGSGFEFTYADAGITTRTGERLTKIRIGGRVHDALTALRAIEFDKGVAHNDAP
jgi:hypothetical protein